MSLNHPDRLQLISKSAHSVFGGNNSSVSLFLSLFFPFSFLHPLVGFEFIRMSFLPLCPLETYRISKKATRLSRVFEHAIGDELLEKLSMIYLLLNRSAAD